MKKYISIIFIYILALTVFMGCEDEVSPSETNDPEVTKVPDEEVEAAFESYVISEMQTIEHESEIEYNNDGVISCKLLKIIMDGTSVSGLEIRFDDNTREIFTLEDIEGKVYDRVDKDGNVFAEITFFAGGKARLYEGEMVNIFVDEEGYYTFNSSESISADTKVYTGEVTGFEFMPLTDSEKSLVLEHITVELDGGKLVHVPIIDDRVKSINSKGDIHIDYEGSINSRHIFSVNVDENFGMIVNYNNGDTASYSIGTDVELEKIDSTTYKLADNYDNAVYSALVTEFILRTDNGEVTGMDSIELTIDQTEDISMTMNDLGCEYAVPFGNFVREYDSVEGSEDMLLDVLPSADFGLELYYNGKARVTLSYTSEIEVFRDFLGRWHINAY